MCLPSGGGDTGGGMDASTFGTAAMGMQALGLGMSASGAKRKSELDRTAYEYQAAVERNRATVDDWRASDAIDRGQQTEFSQRLKEGQVEGTQRATFAARGLDVNEGSPARVLADTRYMGNLDAATISDNSAREAWVLRESARTGRNNADFLSYRAAQENPNREAASSLIGGAGNLASSWYRMFGGGSAAGGAGAGGGFLDAGSTGLVGEEGGGMLAGLGGGGAAAGGLFEGGGAVEGMAVAAEELWPLLLAA